MLELLRRNQAHRAGWTQDVLAAKIQLLGGMLQSQFQVGAAIWRMMSATHAGAWQRSFMSCAL